jgi:hypothetical protein
MDDYTWVKDAYRAASQIATASRRLGIEWADPDVDMGAGKRPKKAKQQKYRRDLKHFYGVPDQEMTHDELVDWKKAHVYGGYSDELLAERHKSSHYPSWLDEPNYVVSR